MNKQAIINIIILVVLLFGGLYLSTKLGYIHCTAIPNWCDVYTAINEAVLGRPYPFVLVAYGNDGMGDPKAVYEYFTNVCRLKTQIKNINNLYLGNLKRYDAIIVTHAKTLSTEQLEMLWDYAAGGGKLILIGDVGTKSNKDDYLRWEDLEGNREGIVNVWDRKKETGDIIQFGSFLLGLKYIGEGTGGELVTELGELTDGLPRRMSINIPFAAVKVIGASAFGPYTVEGVIENTRQIGDEPPPYPAILRVGYRLFYISFPPEEMGNMLIYNNLCRVVT